MGGLFAALGDSTRRGGFFALMEKERSIGELAQPLGITLGGLGQHIRVLEAASLVRTRKVGRERRRAIDLDGLERLETFALRTLWRSRFDAPRRVVEE